MTSVFIGGSRAVSRLNADIREQLDRLIARRCRILIGDANGADKAVQQHFAGQGYANVIVFCMDSCRNNVGGWPEMKIQAQTVRRDFAYYATKDLAMAREAKCGVMLWDGKSRGTLHNILNLLGAGKKTLVYFSPDKSFSKLTNAQDLEALLARCDRRALARIQTSLSAMPPGGQNQLPLHPD